MGLFSYKDTTSNMTNLLEVSSLTLSSGGALVLSLSANTRASQARFCWSVWLNIWSRVRLKRESWKIGVREKRREREIAEEGDTLSLGVGWSSKRAVNRCITFVGPFPPNGEKYGARVQQLTNRSSVTRWPRTKVNPLLYIYHLLR